MPDRSSRESRSGDVLLVAGHATGGIGAHVASLAGRLPGHGWRPTVLTSAVTAARFDLGPAVVTDWPSGRDPRELARTQARIRRLMTRADVVHAHGHQAGTLAAATLATLPRHRRPPLVISWHNAILGTGARSRAFALAERLQVRRADLVTGASGDLVERARRLGARHPELAPVASSLTSPEGTAGAGIRADGRRAVLTVSRIAPQKNLDVLVEAAGLLAAAVPDLLWLVAGDGDQVLQVRLEERIATLGAPVQLLGARSDVPALLAGAELFALPSQWEARSLAVQEAMAAGLPIVASRVGGLPDLLSGTGEPGDAGDGGLLVTPGSAPELAEAAARILGDPELAARLGRNARRRYEQLPTESDVAAAWATTYARLIHR